MKKLILFTIVTAVLAVARDKAAAQTFNLTGTGIFNKAPSTNGSTYTVKTFTMSYNNAFFCNLISNDLVNAANPSNGFPVTVPANCSIMYDPLGNDGKYQGVFDFFNDKSTFFFPLSGYDANSNYYSFMKLNADDNYFGKLGLTVVTNNDCCCCCCDDDHVYSFTYNQTTGSGPYSAVDTASIWVHSDPYPSQHDDLNSIHLYGTFKPDLSVKDNILVRPSTATFTGIGSIILSQPTYYETGVVSNVSIKFNF